MKKQCYVLLGDVVKSREIKKRSVFDVRLKEALDGVQRQYAKSFILPVRTWKGIDEIAAVLNSIEDIYSIIDDINDTINPEQMRFALAKGVVEIEPGEKDVTRADGEAFHKAAGLMAELKKQRWLFAVDAGSEIQDIALHTQVNMLLLIKSLWTEKQRAVFREYKKFDNQATVAEKLKVTQQTVSKALRSIAGFEVTQLERQVIKWTHATY